MERNLTKDSVLKTVLEFSLPYLLSYFLQTLYGMADLFIIGQYNGVESITAVSVGSQVMHMLTVMLVGLAMGATVMIGKAIGAGKKREASLAVGNTVTLFMALSAVLTVSLFFTAEPIAILMSTPAACQDFHSFTIRFPFSASVFRCPILRLNILRIRCFRWDLPLRRALHFPPFSVSRYLSGWNERMWLHPDGGMV